jgi:hypothetical protein
MQTAVEWLGNEITNRITRRNPHDTIIIQTLGEVLIELIEQAKEMEREKSYNLDDLRNAYRWGITATIGTSDHFEEFVNNIKSE